MQTMNISLPDSMKHFIERQVAAGGYSSASEYVRALVRDEQQRQDRGHTSIVRGARAPSDVSGAQRRRRRTHEADYALIPFRTTVANVSGFAPR